MPTAPSPPRCCSPSPQADFRALSAKERASLAAIGKMGVGLSLASATSLRFDYAELQGLGFKNLRIDATRFLRAPRALPIFMPPTSPPMAAASASSWSPPASSTSSNCSQLFEDGITLAQGPHIAGPGPVRPDLQLDRRQAHPSLRAGA